MFFAKRPLYLEHHFNVKTVVPRLRFPTIKIIRPWERIIFVMDMVNVASLYQNRVSKTYYVVKRLILYFFLTKP